MSRSLLKFPATCYPEPCSLLLLLVFLIFLLQKPHVACGVQMTAIMLNFDEARRNLALPMHGLLVNGGMS